MAMLPDERCMTEPMMYPCLKCGGYGPTNHDPDCPNKPTTEPTMVIAKLAAKRCSVSEPTFAVDLKTMRDFILNLSEAAKTCQHEWETLHDGAVGCRKCYADKAVWEATHHAYPVDTHRS